MYSYTFHHIGTLSELDFSRNIIWVFHATKIPPHIGFSAENTFYSLKVSGKDEALNGQNVLDLIRRRGIPSLLVQLNTDQPVEELHNAYSTFATAVYGQTTCLTPIRNLLGQPEALQLSDLLFRMNDRIEKVAGIHLPEDYMALPSYSMEDIQMYIHQLSNHDTEQ